MALGNKLSSDILLTTLINLSQKIRGLVFIPIITGLLDTAAYGAFVQVEVLTRLSAKFSQLGLEKALIKYTQSGTDIYHSKVYISINIVVLMVSSAVAGLIFVTADLISSLFLNTVDYSSVFKIGSLLVPIYASQVMGQNYYRSKMRIKSFSVLEGVKTYLKVGAVLVALFIADVGLFGLVSAIVLVESIFTIGVQVAVLQSVGLQIPQFEEFDTFLRYSIPIMISDLSGMAYDRVDRLLIGFFIGANAVGVYSISYSVAKLIRMYVIPLQLTFFPEFSRLWEANEREQCYHYLLNGIRYLTAVAIPSIFGFYLIGEQLVHLLSTPEAAAKATILLPVIAIGIALIGLDALYRQLFLVDGRTTMVAALRIIGVFLNIGLNLVFIPWKSVVGAALATTGTSITLFGMIYILTLRDYNIDTEHFFVMKVLASAISMFLIVLISGIENVGILLLICPPIYFIFLTATNAIDSAEIHFILNTVSSSLTRT